MMESWIAELSIGARAARERCHPYSVVLESGLVVQDDAEE